MPNAIEQLDAQISNVLSEWSLLTTLLAVVIVAFTLYPILTQQEPDIHPLLLARQSSINPVRHKNSSAVYRSPEVPHDSPLKSGLNVKDAGAPRWATGKDGDVRDVWREVLRGGSAGGEGKENVSTGSIMTVFGSEEVVEHDVVALSREIQIVGKHLQEHGVKKVAIYLPNSVEYLLTVFACSFYGISPILLPYNLPHPKVYELLNATEATGLICAAGNLPLEDVAKACKNLRLLTWVVEKTSRHMDWNGVPDSAQGRLNVSVWHDVVEDNKSKATSDLPSNETGSTPTDIITVTQPKDMHSKPTITTLTQKNIVSATAALISAIPLRQRFTPNDLVLPANSFNNTYVLCQTFAALYTHANLVINSVAQPGVDLALATRGVAPTVIIASAETLAKLHKQEAEALTSPLQRLGKYTSLQTLSSGRMPNADGLLFKLLAPSKSASGNAPGKLRLILTSLPAQTYPPLLSSPTLSDLRIYTRARICLAMTAPSVAGAVAQTGVFDYRSGEDHFGIPLSSVEVKLRNSDDSKLDGSQPEGEIVVKGPAVSGGGEVDLGVKGMFREDGTLALT